MAKKISELIPNFKPFIPKDVYAWCAWAESLGYKPEVTRDLLKANKKWIAS